ncbi:UNVERIFIED_CONTAM: hypothetical protein RKD50_001210 [Streptomyces canus]
MEPTHEQLAAGQPKGLTPQMCTYLRGATPDELSADADAFLAAFAPPAPPAVMVGGNRGVDVGSGNGAGTLGAGAALYRERNGLDDDGRRPEQRPAVTGGRNPYATRTYNMESR